MLRQIAVFRELSGAGMTIASIDANIMQRQYESLDYIDITITIAIDIESDIDSSKMAPPF
ncbi:GH12285 [Drosophila grimshawi]|uniref:GH12285 n=1 Tax=Drosophila grimshawi TaxID=7222 RepID=B4JJB8_DROGR|nr:GH12285 [Drosophila grimshawi]